MNKPLPANTAFHVLSEIAESVDAHCRSHDDCFVIYTDGRRYWRQVSGMRFPVSSGWASQEVASGRAMLAPAEAEDWLTRP